MDLSSVPPPLRPLVAALAAALRNREPAIRQRVDDLRAAHPYETPDRLARLLVRETRRRVAGTAALSGATAIVPGIGTVIGIGTATGQTVYALEQEAELVMGIAMIYGHELSGQDQRILEALVVLGIAGGGIKLRDNVLIAGGQRVAVSVFRRVPDMLLARAGGHLVERGLARLVATSAGKAIVKAAPLAVGMAAGAGFDWTAVTVLGRAANRYYGPGGPVAQPAHKELAK